MNKKLIISSLATLALGASLNAATVTLEAVDVRGSGVFGHTNGTLNSVDGQTPSTAAFAANPLVYNITFTDLDLDGDATADDSVTFDLIFNQVTTTGLRAFNQGTDTGFGSLNNLTASIDNVVGSTGSGDAVQFDGFLGAAIGAGVGAGTDLDRSAEINGVAKTIFVADNGSFRFATSAEDFALTPTVTFGNSGGTAGSIVARHYDLQFSTVPEPSSYAMLAGVIALGAVMVRRRRS